MKAVIASLSIVFMIAGFCGCALFKRPEPNYGKEYNPERRKVGVPVIPDDWKLDSVLRDEARWVNPDRIEKRDRHIPVHWSKYLNYRTGTLLSETDIYYGKNTYTNSEGTYLEKLLITYHYQVDNYDYKKTIGWSIVLYNATMSGFGQDISLEEAEAVLKEWGIQRLDYEFPQK